MRRTVYLLLSAEETGQVVCVQVIFEVAVGEHEEVQIPPSGHHLVERAELLEAQGSLVVIGICLLHKRSRNVCFQFLMVFNHIHICLSIQGFYTMFLTDGWGTWTKHLLLNEQKQIRLF